MRRTIITSSPTGGFSHDYQKLHHKNYALVANPFNDTYQNCKEFMLDVIAAALWQTDDYAQIKEGAL